MSNPVNPLKARLFQGSVMGDIDKVSEQIVCDFRADGSGCRIRMTQDDAFRLCAWLRGCLDDLVEISNANDANRRTEAAKCSE